jgi:four helix bundle protein
VGANYREALRASSKRHFISILETALREADETSYWLELLAESGIVKPALLGPLTEEANQLTAILAATVRTAKKTLPTRQARKPKSEI